MIKICFKFEFFLFLLVNISALGDEIFKSKKNLIKDILIQNLWIILLNHQIVISGLTRV